MRAGWCELRKGRCRDDTWFHVSWALAQAVTVSPVPHPAAEAGLARLRVLRFVPHPNAVVPAGPPGMFDRVPGPPPPARAPRRGHGADVLIASALRS